VIQVAVWQKSLGKLRQKLLRSEGYKAKAAVHTYAMYGVVSAYTLDL
jgi:hypothetical protein